MATNANTTASVAGRASMRTRAAANSGGPDSPAARCAAEKNAAASAPNAPVRNNADTESIELNTARTTRQPVAAPMRSTP